MRIIIILKNVNQTKYIGHEGGGTGRRVEMQALGTLVVFLYLPIC